jgi:hypothetical protein
VGNLWVKTHAQPYTTLCNCWIGLHSPAQCVHEHHSMTLKSMYYVNGFSTKVKLDSLSTREPSLERSKGSVGFSNAILTFGLENPQGLTQSVFNVLTARQLTSISWNLRLFWMRNRSPGVMFTIWMKMGASDSEVVAGECKPLNTSFHITEDLITNYKVQTCNWSQLLSVFALMGLALHLDSFSQGKNSIWNGLMLMTISGMPCYNFGTLKHWNVQ